GLLDASSIDRVLPRLTHAEAAALWRAVHCGDAGAEASALVSLALLRPDGVVPAPVSEAVAGRPDPTEEVASAPPQEAPATAAALAAERGFTSVAMVADALLAIRESPLGLLTGGGIAAGEKKRLAEIGVPVDAVDDIIALAMDAHLLRASGRRLQLTPNGDDWLHLPATDRWARLAEAF